MSVPAKFPANTSFLYIPYTEEHNDLLKCAIPTQLNMDSFADKKVVIVGIPGAFTPTCSNTHAPAYIAKEAELKAKGVDKVIILTVDNPFANAAWARVLGVKNSDFFAFATDIGAQFSESWGFNRDAPWTKTTGRWAAIVDHGDVKYAEIEKERVVDLSSVETILSKL